MALARRLGRRGRRSRPAPPRRRGGGLRVALVAVGRLRASPERALVDDWLGRFDRAGRPLGLGPATEVEVEAPRGSAGGPVAEGGAILARLPRGGWLCCLDERGEQLSSPDLAARLDAWKAERRDAAFVLGGADGLDPVVTARADLVLSLGRMVWPHLLARAMLAEQLYRAATILAGAPYHRA